MIRKREKAKKAEKKPEKKRRLPKAEKVIVMLDMDPALFAAMSKQKVKKFDVSMSLLGAQSCVFSGIKMRYVKSYKLNIGSECSAVESQPVPEIAKGQLPLVEQTATGEEKVVVKE